jgi:hypothetical protein
MEGGEGIWEWRDFGSVLFVGEKWEGRCEEMNRNGDGW